MRRLLLAIATLAAALTPGAANGATGCMPNPSACGYPDIETTGVQPGVSLAPVNGTVTLGTPGMVYENKVVTGSINVTATNVTIRNVRLINTDDDYAIRVRPGGDFDRNDANLKVLHTEIDLGLKQSMNGIAFNGYTLRNVLIRNGNDCAAMSENVVIEDSLCALGPDANRDGQPDGAAFNNQPAWCDAGPNHYDGFQSDGGNNIFVRHNTIRNPCTDTSAILLDSDEYPVRNARIEDNLMAGGGYTLYCAASSGIVSNITAINNRFARDYWPKSGYYGPTTYCDRADDFSGNIWDDTNKPLDDSPPSDAPSGGCSTKATAKLSVLRARAGRMLSVVAPISSRASGTVRVTYTAAGVRSRFTARVRPADRQISIRRRLPRSQARAGTGILRISYPGDGDTRAQSVRLRAAPRSARLTVKKPVIAGGRVTASGRVARGARGVVNLRIEYQNRACHVRTLKFQGRISAGRWRISKKLTSAQRAALATRMGAAQAHTLFTGYLPRRIGGEMRSFQVLGSQ